MALLSSVKPCMHLLWARQQHLASVLHGHLRSRIKGKWILQTPTLSSIHTLSEYEYEENDQPGRANFKKTNPALYKIMEKYRVKDKLSKDWDLIFSDHMPFPKYPAYWYILFPRLMPPLWFTLGIPLHMSDIMKDLYSDEFIIYGSFVVPAYVETLIAFGLLSFLNLGMWNISCSVPHRIYYNYEEDKYMCIGRSLIPGVHRRVEYTADDVKVKQPSWLARTYFPWVCYTYYLKDNKSVLLDPLFLRPTDLKYMVHKVRR